MRSGQAGSQLVKRNAGGVAGKNLIALELRLDLAVKLALGLGVLVNRLDRQVGAGHALALDIGAQATRGLLDFFRCLELFFVQLARAIQRGLDELHLAILQGYLKAAEGCPGGNVTAHHAGTDDMHMLDRGIDARALALQTLLQEEDADQILCGRRLRQLGDRTRLQLQSLSDARAAALPHVDHGEWRGVVLLANLGGGLLDHDRRENLSGQPGIRRPRLGAKSEWTRMRATQQMTRFGQ